MGHGSQLVYISQPLREKVPSAWQALRMALISPWAVGSLVVVTLFAPSPMIFPSLTITAAKGPPAPERTFSVASSMARCMKTGLGSIGIFTCSLKLWGGIMDSMAQAFVSTRVVTPEGIRGAAILEDEGRIRGLCAPGEVPPGYVVHDFGELAVLPGLVDSHVHINEPGRTEWEASGPRHELRRRAVTPR